MSLSPRAYRRAIAAQIEVGFSLEEIKDFINTRPIDEELKSALWLFARAYKPAGMRSFAESELAELITPEDRSEEHSSPLVFP
jgi:DNA-binding transcriptional MerR regulator